jgi:hypothetical protein
MLMSDERDQFQSRVEHLIEQVKRWVEPHEWVTKDYPKKMRDANGHSYLVAALFLQKGPTRLLLDPIAYDVPGAQGVVDLYLMPTYDDMASLYFEDGRWTIHYPFAADAIVSHSAIDASVVPLGEETINQVLDLIAAHAEPSF